MRLSKFTLENNESPKKTKEQIERDAEKLEATIKNFKICDESYNRLKRYITPVSQFPPKRKWNQIGKGAFGNVYCATWQHSKVAIKITKNSSDNPNNIKNIIKEAESLDKCANHSNVCRFLGIVFELSEKHKNKSIWLVTKYYENGSLKQYLLNQLKAETPVPFCIKCDFIRQAAIGLNFLHTKDIVHRDVAARNFLVGKALDVVITDL
eukprot:UN25625